MYKGVFIGEGHIQSGFIAFDSDFLKAFLHEEVLKVLFLSLSKRVFFGKESCFLQASQVDYVLYFAEKFIGYGIY